MTERKTLDSISWNVSEEEYRKDSSLSYSILAKYEREGFNNLDKLFDKDESSSLTFGSVVDTLITGTDEEFNSKFMVASFPIISDSVISIMKIIYNLYKDLYNDIRIIPNNLLLSAISDISWNNHWKPDTRANKIKEDGAEYYKLLYTAGDRSIIDMNMYNDACNTVSALKNSDATKYYFAQNSPFDNNIERYYQLKFKAEFEGVPYRCMADSLLVIHDKKLIVPIDLKTSSSPEWDFYKSFIKWLYPIQARLYWKIIRYNLDKDPYYKDFKLADYRFIVANKKTLVPLIWEYPHTTAVGELKYGSKKDIIMRDPMVIGNELWNYLQNNPKVPNDINLTYPNNLIHWIDKL